MASCMMPLEQEISEDVDALIASDKAKALSKQIGFSEVEQTKIAIATLELARNIVVHAMGKGKITITRLTEPKQGILIIAIDKGSGIPNVEDALERNEKLKKGLGYGLSSVKRLMDELTIETKLGEGTTVTAKKWKGALNQFLNWNE